MTRIDKELLHLERILSLNKNLHNINNKIKLYDFVIIEM